jgi:23S rRNA pseudouridine2605 synthase
VTKKTTEAPAPEGDPAEIKPKARKKKVAAEPELAESSVAAEPEVELAKPAKKAAKKMAKKPTAAVAEKEVPAQESLFKAEAAIEETPKAAKPKKAAKSPKKDKGRDLVVDEPGAQEVDEVLHHAIDHEKAIEAAEKDSESTPEVKGPEPKLERLQKILAKAGISSRRKAEELILGGRVQINGKVVMELGTKADPARDHVRVDGKLLQGPERIRYFVLNKPKGYVTTVSDPEGRPTVMQFFTGEHERLYPVGRLDYLSEGLLLVTNDGELANKLTKAASGVEKTYLVKVAGQPTEDMLDVLRGGVVIEKGRPGTYSGRVRTAPAKIRQVRQGDNPWYEVVIIEGRNRELRKMFEEIGHHVEKIRRVGYGPLILDLEPGKLRELEAEEVHLLQLAAAGKLKKKTGKSAAAGQLPTVAGKTVRYKKADGRPGYERPSAPAVKREFKSVEKRTVRPEFQQESKGGFNPAFKGEPRKEFKPEARPGARPGTGPAFRSEFKSAARPASRPEFKPEFKREGKPEFKRAGRPDFRTGSESAFKPGFKAAGRPPFGGKPRGNRPLEPAVTDYVLPPRKAGYSEPDEDQPRQPRPAGARPSSPRPAPNSRSVIAPRDPAGGLPAGRRMYGAEAPGNAGKWPFDKPSRPSRPGASFARPSSRVDDDDFVFKKTPGFRVEPVIERPREDRPREERPRSGGFSRPAPGGRPFRPAAGRPSGGDRPFRPKTDRPARPDRPGRPVEGRGPAPSGDRPFRPRGEFRPGNAARPASGERPVRFAPRTDGPPAGRPKPFGAGAERSRAQGSSDDRPREFRPRAEGAPPKKFAGAKPAGARPSGARPGSPGKTGPDGEPRKKERWRNSFTGKNKGRPKPKA